MKLIFCSLSHVPPFCYRLLCASLRLRASAYADVIEVLAEHAAQFEVLLLLTPFHFYLVFLSLLLSKAVAKHIELVREQLQERCDALPL